ncbi:MAG: hypothetical protein F4213_09990 [Boseongicola sp. SB0677_bin_26]|nr:hypothetical protein [Boseongicola sp. SB0677_bin_26]
MRGFSAELFPVLFPVPSATTGLAEMIGEIDVDALCREYCQLRKAAPKRSACSKRHFVGHDGRPEAKKPGCASERHLAIALWRLRTRWPRAGTGWMRLLDYEFPLKASNSDRGIGKVDLLGVTDRSRLVIIELKVCRKDGSRGDAPLVALMEGLRYAAVVQANLRAIAAEARERCAIDVSEEPPIVQIMAPEDWWRGWCGMVGSTRRAAGAWEPKFLDLSAKLKDRLGVLIECVSLEGISLADVTWDDDGPRFAAAPPMRRVCLTAPRRLPRAAAP